MKKQHFAAVSLGALALAGGSLASISRGNTSQKLPQNPPQSAPRAAAQAAAVGSAVGADAGGFRASEFAGVSVRERPAQESGAPRGLVGARPGAARPTGAELRAFTSRGAIGALGALSVSSGWRKKAGTTALGGTRLVGGPLHSEVARRRASGQASSVECVPEKGIPAKGAAKASR